ncbi:unnamed protein product [Mytilus edulis]|uniref:Gag protein n=1 Tax=Mytilus edulis TaxID=6550 RepID=A0A8S3U4U8_MYTED|nr:unnamed protein product [Mytilus edulis]
MQRTCIGHIESVSKNLKEYIAAKSSIKTSEVEDKETTEKQNFEAFLENSDLIKNDTSLQSNIRTLDSIPEEPLFAKVPIFKDEFLFKEVMEYMESKMGLENKDDKLRTATLLTCIGEDALLDIFNGFVFANEGETNDIDAVIEKFENFCIGKTNETYERYCFNKRDQEQGENIDTYVAALRTLVKTCNYGTIEESLIRDRIVIGLRENSTRKKLLQDAKLTLNRCVDICRANEETSIQIKDISQEEVQYVRRRDQKPRKNFTPRPQTDKKFDDCKYCGRQHVQKREACPAWGKTCANKPTSRQNIRITVHNI